MTTVRDLLTDALREIGAYGVAESVSSNDAVDALGKLNQMLSLWRTEELMVYSMEEQVFPSAPTGVRSFTIGAGGDLDTPRPVRIDFAANRDANGNDYPINVTRQYQDYALITSKQVQSSLVTILYYDPTYPLGTIYVWPERNDGSYSLVLWTWTALDSYSSIDATVSLPEGYEFAIVTNLAIRLCPRYGRKATVELAEAARASKAQIKKNNLTVKKMGFERALTNGGYTFNWLTGEPT